MRRIHYNEDKQHMLAWVKAWRAKGFRVHEGMPSLRSAVDAYEEAHPLKLTIASDNMLSMEQQIRIAVDIEQQTVEGVPMKCSIQDENGKKVPMYRSLSDKIPMKEEWVDVDIEGGRVFVDDGGDYTLHFKWTATDGEEREFKSGTDIPVPPYCPNCEQRVPYIPPDDYLCEKCRGW